MFNTKTREGNVFDRPLPVELTQFLIPEDHDEVCTRLGITNTAKDEIKLKNFLLKQQIPLFEYWQVHAYLTKQAQKLAKIWRWYPLRRRDVGTHTDCVLVEARVANAHWPVSYGSSAEIYNKTVPTHILLNVEKVQKAFPQARFFVSDIATYKDPFMAVILPDVGIYVIGVWDEPGFGQ